jgi:predicted RNase H-like nuclease (RuvC/YqgF family)
MPGTPPLEPIPEEEKEEAKEEEAKPQEPPTMSPDERDVMEEEIKQEQLSEQKKDMPTTKRQPRTNIATFKSKMESIPESRLGTQGKEVNELFDDIEFFLKEFPSQLKNEKTIFNKIDKNNKNDLIKLHTKIATKLKPNISSSSSSSNKKLV